MLDCKKCGIAEETGDGLIFCHKYRTVINLRAKTSRQDCIYYTSKIDEGGEILSPQEHLYLKEAELAATPRKTVSMPNRRRFIAKNFAIYPGNNVEKDFFKTR